MNVIIPNQIPDVGSFTSSAGKPYTDSSGVAQTAAANQLRPSFIYEGGRWVFKGALIDGTDSMTSKMATNAVDTATSHGAWVVGTTYAVGNTVTYLNYRFESRVASNIGNTPDTVKTTDKWIKLGPVNRWAALDPTVETQTTASNYLLYRFVLSELTTGIAVLNVVGTKIWVVMTDPVEGIVYSAEKDLISTTNITDFWEWFNLPIETNRDAVFLGLPSFPLASVDVLILAEGGTAKCGVVSLGVLTSLGKADYGTSIGIVDYSKVSEDDFGNRILTRRSYAKRINVPITLQSNEVDAAARMLAEYRQIPMVWIASEHYEATIVFGPYKSFEIVITLWSQSRCNLEIQGFI